MPRNYQLAQQWNCLRKKDIILLKMENIRFGAVVLMASWSLEEVF